MEIESVGPTGYPPPMAVGVGYEIRREGLGSFPTGLNHREKRGDRSYGLETANPPVPVCEVRIATTRPVKANGKGLAENSKGVRATQGEDKGWSQEAVMRSSGGCAGGPRREIWRMCRSTGEGHENIFGDDLVCAHECVFFSRECTVKVTDFYIDIRRCFQ